MTSSEKQSLFEDDGSLCLDRLSDDAREVLEGCLEMLQTLGRKMFLPLDLMIILIHRGNRELAHVIAGGADGMVPVMEVETRLRALAKEIDEDNGLEEPALDKRSFSRGFSRILTEAWDQLVDDREHLEEKDIVQSVIWRAEAVESASVRWAIRRLGEGGGDVLFDKRGLLREDVFTPATWTILKGSVAIAAGSGTPFLGTPHLVAMLCSIKDAPLWRSAQASGFEPSRLREELLRLIGGKPNSIREFQIGRKTLTPRMVRMLSLARRAVEPEPVDQLEIIEAFLEDGGSSLELVQALGLESEIRRSLGEPKVLEGAIQVEAAIRLGARKHATPTLDLLGRDLTADALAGRLPEIVGRETELRRVVNVLLRREQRNPLLTGEAGVGKTALAVALAQRIADGRVPEKLLGHRLVEINGASLMSGTSYRGDLESRIKSLLDEANKDVILFIDEAHAVFAPRAGSHAPAEVPNHFKSALASGDIAVVGATTEEEYRRWFEQDSALKRRFERVEIGEPGQELVSTILSALVDELESEYGVTVEDEAVEAAVELSTRYMPEQRLPDKAKKLLMDACICTAHGLDDEEDAGESKTVGRVEIAKQVFQKVGIPMERLLRGTINWWVGLEERLNETLVGQESAVREVCRALIAGRLRKSGESRPMAVMMFVGPSGIGKGTLAKALALEVYNDIRSFIRLDMTDFQEPHTLSRLIGSPPGYVGYEDEDVLVTPLRRRPGCVVFMEDFDKAHHRVQERILRLVAEGEITDTRGCSADATNAIFVLSTNVVPEDLARIGFSNDPGQEAFDVKRVLERHDQEFAQRVRQHVPTCVLFQGLGGDGEQSSRYEILNSRIADFTAGMKNEYRVVAAIDETLMEFIRRETKSVSTVRQIDTLVEEYLYQPITLALLDGISSPGLTMVWDDSAACVRVDEGDGK